MSKILKTVVIEIDFFDINNKWIINEQWII